MHFYYEKILCRENGVGDIDGNIQRVICDMYLFLDKVDANVIDIVLTL